MNYLISGLAKSGTTILFSRMQQAITPPPATYFEPDTDEQLTDILAPGADHNTLTKVLIGRVTNANSAIDRFDRHVLIYRDPRDQFISMLLYLFYDFQVNGDKPAYEQARAALERKVLSPAEYSTVELYNEIAGLVGRAPIAVFGKLHQVQQAYAQAFSPMQLRYEDFVDGALEEVQAYLQLDLHNDAEVPEQYGRVARSKGYGGWTGWLNEEDLAFVNQAWGGTISSLGYQLTETSPALGISRHSSLDYVAQFDPAQAG